MSEPHGAGPLGIELFVVLLGIAALVALATRRIPVPYSVALVLAGLGLGALLPDQQLVTVDSELILAVLLPGLVFEAAYKMDVGHLRSAFPMVSVMAAPGVLVTAGLVAVAANVLTGLDLPTAFLLGAIVSATDPVAVVALFKRIGAPGRLATAVEAESLLNDGTGVVLFAIALRALAEPVTLADGVLSFVATVAISAVLGLVAGRVAGFLLGLTDDHLLEVTITVVGAYGTYLLADRLHQSGIIATVVVGLVLASLSSPKPITHHAREVIGETWEVIAFLLTALTFLLMGLVISPALLVTAAPLIAVAFVAMTAGRAISTYGLVGIGSRIRPIGGPISTGFLHVVFWSGLRGAIAVALVLSLPADMPNRDLVTGAVYGVVLITLLVQGTTAGLVVRRSGVLEAAAD